MNYIKQLNAFWEWRELHDLTHTQADIYLALLDIFNRAHRPSALSIPNRTIMSKADISDKKQLITERAVLCSLGLVEYTQGEHKKTGVYSVVTLYDTTEQPQTDPEFTPEITPNLPLKNTTINKKEKEKKEEKEKSVLSSNDEDETAQIQAIFDSYNAVCKSLPCAEKLTAKRKTQIRARLKAFGIEQIKQAFNKAEQSDFLTGRRGEWHASLDWFMANDGNILKVIEGNYDNNSPTENTTNYTTKHTTNYTTENTTDLTPTKDTAAIEAAFRAAYIK